MSSHDVYNYLVLINYLVTNGFAIYIYIKKNKNKNDKDN